MQPVDPQAHDAPLVELVARLHAGTTLRERVVKLRWRRKRVTSGTAGARASVETDSVLAEHEHGKQVHPASAPILNSSAAAGGEANNEMRKDEDE